MKTLTLFGASGLTGQAIIQEASKNNIKIIPFNKRLPTIQDIKDSLKNVDAVVIVFGPRYNSPEIFCNSLTRLIIAGMKDSNVNRLICQTGAMIGDYEKNRSLFFNLMSNQYKKQSPEGYLDRQLQETAVRESGLDWTIIKPPRLTNALNERLVYSDENLKVGLMSSISRKSLANFILQEVTSDKNTKKSIFLKN